jgi:hypothetical protein
MRIHLASRGCGDADWARTFALSLAFLMLVAASSAMCIGEKKEEEKITDEGPGDVDQRPDNLTLDVPRANGSFMVTGQINASEAAQCAHYTLEANGYKDENATLTLDLFAAHDGGSLYLGLRFNGTPEFILYDLDPENDGSARAGGEDYVKLTGEGDYLDRCWDDEKRNWVDDEERGGSVDGSGDRCTSCGHYEVMKPLASGDDADMNVTSGDVMGFRVEVYMDKEYYRWPQGTVDHDFNKNGMGDEIERWGALELES